MFRQVAGFLLGNAGGHRPAADEDGGDVAAHGGHQHAGHDLVAVGDADHAVETVGPDHGLDAVGDELAGGQGIFHAAVAHGDAVVDTDGVEDERHAAGFADETFDEGADLVQVGVAGDAIGVAVGDGDKRFPEIVFRLDAAGGAQQAAMRGALNSAFDGIRSHGAKYCTPDRAFAPAFQALRPVTPRVLRVMARAFCRGRNLRTAAPACHISELRISASSAPSCCW